MAGVEKECLDAFWCGRKKEALKLLPKLRSPETIRDSRRWWEGCTLVHYAARYGWADVSKLLIEEYNLEPTAVDDNGSSPLNYASAWGLKASVKYLLSLPSVLKTINDKDKWGDTPLHYACRYGCLAVIELLLEIKSVNIAEKNNRGIAPVDMLLHYRYDVLARLANKIGWHTQIFVQSFFNVFLVGNSAAGKSTLAAVMLELAGEEPTQHGRISNVEELTVGVVPTRCKG